LSFHKKAFSLSLTLQQASLCGCVRAHLSLFCTYSLHVISTSHACRTLT